MANGKKTFILYCDMIHNFEVLEDAEAGRVIKHLFKYVNDQNPEPPDRITQIAFEPIKQRLRKDLKAWEKTLSLLSDAGKLGGIASGEARRSQSKPHEGQPSHGEPNEGDNVNVIVNDNVNDKYIIAQTSFEAFWNLYDKKRSRDKAFAKWCKLPLKDQKAAMEYIPKYKLAQPDKTYRKDPCTFLNNKSWNDELIQAKVPGAANKPWMSDRWSPDNEAKCKTPGQLQEFWDGLKALGWKFDKGRWIPPAK